MGGRLRNRSNNSGMAGNLQQSGQNLNMTDKRTDSEKNKRENSPSQPDRETLHTPDPQENMKGPVSSTMRKTGEAFETEETKEEADQEKDDNL
jgi:hypothetical protein